MKIEEQEIVFVDRIFGKSKLGPGEVYLYLKGVGKLFAEYWIEGMMGERKVEKWFSLWLFLYVLE